MRKIKAVVVDDNPYTVRAVKKCLEKLELLDRVDDFTDPLMAQEMIEKTRYDLIITDNSMPGIDGVELAERVLSVYKPVMILISVICDQVKRNVSGEDLFDFTYQKPLDYQEFMAEMTEVINKLQQSIALENLEIKDRLFLREIESILKDKDDKEKGIYKKLSEKMQKDESTIRRRLNKISQYIAFHNKIEKPLDLVYKIMKFNSFKENRENEEVKKLS